jgi:hypothetical protein
MTTLLFIYLMIIFYVFPCWAAGMFYCFCVREKIYSKYNFAPIFLWSLIFTPIVLILAIAFYIFIGLMKIAEKTDHENIDYK